MQKEFDLYKHAYETLAMLKIGQVLTDLDTEHLEKIVLISKIYKDWVEYCESQLGVDE